MLAYFSNDSISKTHFFTGTYIAGVVAMGVNECIRRPKLINAIMDDVEYQLNGDTLKELHEEQQFLSFMQRVILNLQQKKYKQEVLSNDQLRNHRRGLPSNVVTLDTLGLRK